MPKGRFAAIENAIPVALCEKLHETPSAALIERIDANLCGAPPERLTERIRARWKNITSLGILERLARDVGKAWAKGYAERAAAEKEAEQRQTPARPKRWEKEGCWEGDQHHWSELSEDMREFYRELHPELREWLAST